MLFSFHYFEKCSGLHIPLHKLLTGGKRAGRLILDVCLTITIHREDDRRVGEFRGYLIFINELNFPVAGGIGEHVWDSFR